MPFLQGKLQRFSSAPLGKWGHISRSISHAHVLRRLVPSQPQIYPGLDRIIGASQLYGRHRGDAWGLMAPAGIEVDGALAPLHLYEFAPEKTSRLSEMRQEYFLANL